MAIINNLPCGSGGGLTKELLWTNPNPNSSYPSAELNIDFSSYDYIMVNFKISTSNVREFSSIGVVSELYTSDTPRPKLSGAYYSSSGTTYHREWGITGAGKFEFYQCYGGLSASNSNVIPLAIYGVKGEIN